jgi:hypothetical protein
MRAGLFACVLVACSAPSRPPPIENIAPADPTREKACDTGKLAGVVLVGDAHNQPAIGATIVATFGSDGGELVTITDENGKFVFDKLEAHDKLVLYYLERTFQTPLPKRCEPEPVTLEIEITRRDPGGAAQPIRIIYGIKHP